MQSRRSRREVPGGRSWADQPRMAAKSRGLPWSLLAGRSREREREREKEISEEPGSDWPAPSFRGVAVRLCGPARGGALGFHLYAGEGWLLGCAQGLVGRRSGGAAWPSGSRVESGCGASWRLRLRRSRVARRARAAASCAAASWRWWPWAAASTPSATGAPCGCGRSAGSATAPSAERSWPREELKKSRKFHSHTPSREDRGIASRTQEAVVPLYKALVVFGKKLPPFSTIILSQLQHEKKYDIYFTDGKIYALYGKLLQHECPLCPDSRAFPAIVELEQHMRKQHELFCCKLCVKHLKIFTYERKWYSRKDLARHRIHGDPDDTSHRGHPLCKFCDERYLDNDELLKHLRRDHYFCHFCDSDGAQEYYSDYEYLREHFREKHFLCEEGRCSTEQFTHAFRTEIDYKAHKTACHSKNRAEARQNRQIDLQFNYAPRHQRRNESVVSGEDYDEVDRYNRQVRGSRSGARGGQQNRRGSWRYKREEEDRDVAAAVRASVAAKRQEEKNRMEDKGDSCRAKKEDAKDPEPTVSKRGVKPLSEESVPKEVAPKAALSKDDFPAIGLPSVDSLQSSSQLAPVKLDEEDFPRLSFSSAPLVVSATLPLSYMATAQKTGFQEEDFPALVSKVRPSSRMVSTLASAWSGGSSKNMARAITATASQPARKGPPPSSSKASKKSKVVFPGNSQDSSGSVSSQEIRSAPTMVDVSSLLAASNSQTFAKVGKKKKVGTEKLRTASPSVLQEVPAAPHSLEKADDAEQPSSVAASPDLPSTSATLVNGHSEKPTLSCRASKEPPGLKKPPGGGQCLLPQEDFPALGNAGPPRMPPPPGFNSVVLLNSPPPPPGLSVPPSKPPPGFTPIPTTSTSENAPAPVKEPKLCQGPYLILENFQQRNIQLIQSIREFLQEDESQFNKFKTYSGQFRQGLISAEQYYKSCQELLGENFKKIFNELLVLLPDTAKQQELLSAYQDLKGKAPAGSSPPSSLTWSKKNRKGVWHTEPPSDLDCCVCPTCQQVLTQQDLVSHQALHLEEDEFPSLQAISRIIS